MRRTSARAAEDIAVARAGSGKVAVVLKTRAVVHCALQDVMETPAGTLELRSSVHWVPLKDEGNYSICSQDWLIGDHRYSCRKVVRVNDVDLEWLGRGAAHCCCGRGRGGLRGAFRRVFKDFSAATLMASAQLRASGIPWQFVDVIEVDPARRVSCASSTPVWPRCTLRPGEFLNSGSCRARSRLYLADEEVAAEASKRSITKMQKPAGEAGEERIADIVEG